MSRLYLILSLLFSTLFLSFQEADDKAIREKSTQFETLFNQHDAKGLAGLWSQDAVYYMPESNEEISGREAIEAAFDAIFKEKPDAHIAIKVDSIQFPAEDVAVQSGVVTLKSGKQIAYKFTYQKKEGGWQITQNREFAIEEAPSQYERLKALEWLVGDWVDKDNDIDITTHTEWDKYKNFITQNFVVKAEGQFVLEGKQIIAWDPINKIIRSWVFDSDGGFGQGSWTKRDASWVVETAHTLADGKRASAVNTYTPVNADSYTWQSEGRMVGGELLPNIDPVTIERVKS